MTYGDIRRGYQERVHYYLSDHVLLVSQLLAYLYRSNDNAVLNFITTPIN